MKAADRLALRLLVDMNALAMFNGLDDDDDDDDEADLGTKRSMLCEMIDAREEWLYGLLEGVSDDALVALAQKRITNQPHLVEISKLFDKAGVEDHVRELLNVMVPGHDFDPEVDDNVLLPAGVRLEDIEFEGEHLREFVKLGAINWIDWILTQHRHFRVCVCGVAARAGELEVLKWARANGCLWNESTCSEAAYGGHLGVIQWARANGCPWNENTCAQAAQGGHLEILKWARARGCPWNHMTCSFAAYAGQFEVLKWGRAHGCPWHKADCARSSHAKIRAWVKEQAA
ncbi:hypothetical protein CTAYLR_004247 [Chrysophaeum taylorii]|uniref:Ankyrin repeat protein n=1 Tax=Chrysophaeum taylorii TaxID=2483200 RepID=A0AAD7UD91_9STRA|nr:hypothetical protein CTAYLR_004247 [Chrysophaeum taylorii]